MSRLREFLNDAATTTPLMSANGKQVYNFDDAQKVNRAELAEEKVTGKQIELGDRMVTGNGLTYAASNVKRAAVDPDTFFENRYRKVEQKTSGSKKPVTKYEVVTDYRAIKEQASGQVYTNNVIVYEISRNESGNLVADTVKTISAEEFISNFKNKLNVDGMMEIFGAISKLETVDVAADKLEL